MDFKGPNVLIVKNVNIYNNPLSLLIFVSVYISLYIYPLVHVSACLSFSSYQKYLREAKHFSFGVHLAVAIVACIHIFCTFGYYTVGFGYVISLHYGSYQYMYIVIICIYLLNFKSNRK